MIDTDIEWPEGVPFALRSSHSLKAASPFRRTPLESGRARQRRLFSSVPTNANTAEIICDSGQAAAFEAWFRDALNDGVEWFGMLRQTPIGRERLIARFTAMYEGPTMVGTRYWKYTCPLEFWERPLMPPGWGEFPGFVAQAGIFDAAMNREWPEA